MYTSKTQMLQSINQINQSINVSVTVTSAVSIAVTIAVTAFLVVLHFDTAITIAT